jgi:Fe-S-cluster containining protein
MTTMCDTCHAGCCRAYNLIVTVYDALQISQDLNLPIAEFVTMVSQNEEGVKRMGGIHTPLRFSDPGFEDTFFYIALKRVESRLMPGTLKCYFLHEWQRAEPIAERGNHPGAKIAGRCGIYASRPLMCQAYPAFLHQDGALGFITNPAQPELVKADPIYTLCPEKWTPGAFAPNVNRTVHNLVLNKYEIEFQNRLISEWNANPRPLKEFFQYATGCYANRFRLVPELVTTPQVAKPAAASEPAPIPE